MKPSFLLLSVLTLLGTAAVRAQVIIYDTFTGTNGTNLSTHTPNTNLPGGTWQQAVINGQPLDTITTSSSYSAPSSATASASSFSLLSIQSSGGYTRPTGDVTLTAQLSLGTISGTQTHRGIMLGFYNTSGDTNPDGGGETYSGLILSPTGSLYLELPNLGNSGQTLLGAFNAAAFGGNAFDASSYYQLNYSVNFSTGLLSNITLSNAQGVESYTAPVTNILTKGTPQYVGYYSAAASAGNIGSVDDLQFQLGVVPVSSVPEPATYALLLGAGTLFFLIRRRSL